MTRKTISIRDVALSAGVSTATVSRTLNTPSVVAEATRRAVFDAVRETGYAANEAARNLRRRRTGCVVALVPNIANQFFSEILAGVAAVMTPAGFNLLIADTRTAEVGVRRLHYLDRNRADGAILFDGAVPRRHLGGESRPPVVMACEWFEDLPLPQVRIDNRAGAGLAVAHLAGLGHSAIGHVTGPAGNVLTAARVEGWAAALRERGLPVREDWVFRGDFTLPSGAKAAWRWLALNDRPDAVFCASDDMACGFIGAVTQAGLRVPRDVSVVGFDDIDLAAYVHPAITTVRQPRRRLGTIAAETLLTLIADGPLAVRDNVQPVELAVRDSTCPPRVETS